MIASPPKPWHREMVNCALLSHLPPMYTHALTNPPRGSSHPACHPRLRTDLRNRGELPDDLEWYNQADMLQGGLPV